MMEQRDPSRTARGGGKEERKGSQMQEEMKLKVVVSGT